MKTLTNSYFWALSCIKYISAVCHSFINYNATLISICSSVSGNIYFFICLWQLALPYPTHLLLCVWHLLMQPSSRTSKVVPFIHVLLGEFCLIVPLDYVSLPFYRTVIKKFLALKHCKISCMSTKHHLGRMLLNMTVHSARL